MSPNPCILSLQSVQEMGNQTSKVTFILTQTPEVYINITLRRPRSVAAEQCQWHRQRVLRKIHRLGTEVR